MENNFLQKGQLPTDPLEKGRASHHPPYSPTCFPPFSDLGASKGNLFIFQYNSGDANGCNEANNDSFTIYMHYCFAGIYPLKVA